MALLDIKLHSKTLRLSTGVSVIIPEERDIGHEWPVLWLYHGFAGDHNSWRRNTSIERYAAGLDLCIIMPSADHSYYTDMAHGNRYYTYLSEELPRMMEAMLPLSPRREDRFVAGLSMGGYGALKLALNNPGRFSAAASLSGALEQVARMKGMAQDDDRLQRFKNVFGSIDELSGSDSDLRHMAQTAVRADNCPRLFLCCGTEDFLYDHNLRFYSLLRSLDLPVTYEEDPGYAHTWDYWDLKIKQVLDWLQQEGLCRKINQT